MDKNMISFEVFNKIRINSTDLDLDELRNIEIVTVGCSIIIIFY